MSRFDYRRRQTVTARVGNVGVGSGHPVVLQSMTSTSTMDTPGSVRQTLRIAEAGGQIVRLTAQGSREATNIGVIRAELRRRGCDVPLVADIHFNPRAAYTAATTCDKVRINPGNFVDPGRTFAKIDFTDEEYAAEIRKIETALKPLLDLCRQNNTALRIGVNHGSLSDRIMSRYGDTPAGMVESAMEFLRVCVAENFTDVVISVKASNVRVMVETMRRLVAAMDNEGMHFPLHLGVTEAGEGEDGRIKSAVGIGTLLAEGIGDTIRVSLSEEPEAEIPVARIIADYATSRAGAAPIPGDYAPGYDSLAPARRQTDAEGIVGGTNPPVVVSGRTGEFAEGQRPDIILDSQTRGGFLELDADDAPDRLIEQIGSSPCAPAIILRGRRADSPERMMALLHRMTALGIRRPVITAMEYSPALSAEEATLRAATDLGRILMNGFADGIMLSAPSLTPAREAGVAFGILQATRLRTTRTEYISCPGCGRTLYDLQSTLRDIKAATSSLKGLKIGVMGCIVNGPGEMADADYGYVGAGPGRVSLYKGKKCIVKNIPAEEAVGRLVALIRENGDWHEEA
ncbi:MAG: (E)-4-hydroxy-3-methylbut-2-enyl-diphosphate synthase [Clostridium sp.]|nr:(E)-4-hydroxy-3-methylbut-2-enyl-diphosphate synthase [Clostridium sp.]